MPTFEKRLTWIAPLILLILMMARVVYFYRSSDDVLVQAVPDDAFYYIQMARHRLSDGFWTFDGVAPATGFHLLYGYGLLWLFEIFGDLGWRTLFLIIGIGSSTCISLSCLLVGLASRRLFKVAWLACYIPFFTPLAVQQSTAMMESWLVLLLSALTVHLGYIEKQASKGAAAGLFMIGVLGSLARSDFGLLPGVLFAANALFHKQIPAAWLQRSFCLLVGAVIGVAIVMAHTHAVSGHFSQASAQVKFFWSHMNGHSIRSVLFLAISVVIPEFRTIPNILKAVTALLFLGGLFAFLCQAFLSVVKRKDNFVRLIPALSCAAVFFGYILFYKFNSSAIAAWYSANFIVPCAIMLPGVIAAATGKFATIFTNLLLASYLLVVALLLTQMLYPSQRGLMRTGLMLKSLPQSHYGSWNAGIISYFSGRKVTNLDGLTNDDLLPYIRSNRLLSYVQRIRIDQIVDFEVMMAEKYRRRGGYDVPSWSKCVRKIRSMDVESPAFQRSHIAMYDVLDKC
jgi:hypothetical protein